MGQQVYKLRIDHQHVGQRIDNFLLSQLKGVPTSRIYRILRKGEVRVNQGRVQPSYKLNIDDLVRIPPIRTAEPTVMPKVSDALSTRLLNAILFENNDLIIINKFAGIPVHGGTGHSLGLIEALRKIRDELRYLELVHRLDKDTSGCLVLAKSRASLLKLQKSWEANQVKKTYYLLVKGRWPRRLNRIDSPISKHHKVSGEWMSRIDPQGKSATTTLQVLDYYKETTLIKAHLLTGRTHQLRVHTASVGHPIVGDSKYGHATFNKSMVQWGVKRLFLHAKRLVLPLPTTGEKIVVEADLSDDLTKVLKQLS